MRGRVRCVQWRTQTLLRRERHVEQHLGRQDQHIGRHAVARHAVLALLDRLVEAELLLLRNTVEHDLVVHRRADVALGAQVLAAVVVEVVVAAGEVGVERVEVAGLLDAVPVGQWCRVREQPVKRVVVVVVVVKRV